MDIALHVDEEIPSLYVRVYRSMGCAACMRSNSLTIREGISPPMGSRLAVFLIPSLYVRVYRRLMKPLFLILYSLTIREGISDG